MPKPQENNNKYFICFFFTRSILPTKRCKVIGRNGKNTYEKFAETVTQDDFIKITLKAQPLSAMKKNDQRELLIQCEKVGVNSGNESEPTGWSLVNSDRIAAVDWISGESVCYEEEEKKWV